ARSGLNSTLAQVVRANTVKTVSPKWADRFQVACCARLPFSRPCLAGLRGRLGSSIDLDLLFRLMRPGLVRERDREQVGQGRLDLLGIETRRHRRTRMLLLRL